MLYAEVHEGTDGGPNAGEPRFRKEQTRTGRDGERRRVKGGGGIEGHTGGN